MSRPESFVRATLAELGEWSDEQPASWKECLAALVREVVAEKDAAFAVERERLGEVSDQYREWWQGAEATVKREYARAERAEAEVARLTRERDDLAIKVNTYDSATTNLARKLTAAESAIADAQRAGAWSVRSALFEYSGVISFRALLDHVDDYISLRYPAPPAPEPPSVTLDAVRFRVGYDLTNGRTPWELYGTITTVPQAFGHLYELLNEIRYTPTPTEYAALVALAQEAK